jgi:hypothetical protein
VMLCVTAAACVLRTGRVPEGTVDTATKVLIVLWLAACLLSVVFRFPFRDWVHLYWSAQIPLVGLFFGSGALLCRTWRADIEDSAIAESGETPLRRERRWWNVNGAVLFLGMAVTLGIAPLLLQIALPEDQPAPRDTGAPVRGLWELAAWGLGGARPATLAPITEAEIASGLGHLPRDITVPMGTTLIAAYVWIAFSLLAMGGRLVRSGRARAALLLLAPLLLAVLDFFAAGSLEGVSYGPFDAQALVPGARDCGIWTCEPAVVRSYGPVLLIAVACTFVLALCLALDQRARKARADHAITSRSTSYPASRPSS